MAQGNLKPHSGVERVQMREELRNVKLKIQATIKLKVTVSSLIQKVTHIINVNLIRISW